MEQSGVGLLSSVFSMFWLLKLLVLFVAVVGGWVFQPKEYRTECEVSSSVSHL